MNGGVAVVGVSADKQEVSDRFGASLELPFPLVGDPKARIIASYDVKWPLLRLASRVTYIIDQDRKIAASNKHARDIQSHIDLACEFTSGA